MTPQLARGALTYDNRVTSADAARRTAKIVEGHAGARLVAILVASRPLHGSGLYYTVQTAVTSGEALPGGGLRLLADVYKRRSGQVVVTHYNPWGFPLQDVPPTRGPNDTEVTIDDAARSAHEEAYRAYCAAQAEACQREADERQRREREAAYAANGKRLVMSGMRGRVFELPPEHRLAFVADETDEAVQVCCWFNAQHVSQHLHRGGVRVPEHTEDCPTRRS